MAFIAFLFRKEKNSSKPEYVLWFSTEHNFQKFGPVNGLGLIMLSNRRGYFEILSVLFFFCDFRGARFFEPELVEGTSLSTLFERASWTNWKTSFKKMFSFHCLTHSETLKHFCFRRMWFFKLRLRAGVLSLFCIVYTSGNESLRQKSIRILLCLSKQILLSF